MEPLSDDVATRGKWFRVVRFQRPPSGLVLLNPLWTIRARLVVVMGVYVPSDRGVLHIPTATRVGRDAISEDFDQLVLFLLVYRRREGFCRAEGTGACHALLQGTRATSLSTAAVSFCKDFVPQ